MNDSPLPVSIRAQWPWQPRFAQVNGWRMHYIDEGTGHPVVLLHGNPTWGFLYRHFVGPLKRAGYRVVIPDMIGFGLSEKPTREEAEARRSPRRVLYGSSGWIFSAQGLCLYPFAQVPPHPEPWRCQLPVSVRDRRHDCVSPIVAYTGLVVFGPPAPYNIDPSG